MKTPSDRQIRIIIIGGGFVGVPTARRLARVLGSSAQIVLVDSKEYFLFTPRLIDALGSAADTRSLYTAKLEDLASRSGFMFVHGTAEEIDRGGCRVRISHNGTDTWMSYDHLVISPGAQTNYYDIPGAKKETFALKTFEDVEKIHTKTIDLVTRAAASSSNSEKQKLLSFAFIGAGPSGVEGICSLKKFVLDRIERTDKRLRDLASFTLIQAAPQILPGFSDAVVEKTLGALNMQGIHVLVGRVVTSIGDGMIKAADGLHLPVALIVWTAGITPNAIPISPIVDRDRGGNIVADRRLKVDTCIYCAGDCVAFTDRNLIIPKNAQTAMLMARYLSDAVVNTQKGKDIPPFSYHSKGNILTLGPTGILDLPHLAIRTPLASVLRDMFYRHRWDQIVGT